MKKGRKLILTACASVFLLWAGHTGNAGELKHDVNAAKQLEIIRKNLSSLTEMKYTDAKKYYEDALKDLNALIEKHAKTEEALEAKFYIGVVYNEMRNFEEAIKCFDTVLSQGEMDKNFKARTLYFMTKALIAKGDIARAKDTVAELKQIEPRAADGFRQQLGSMVRIGMDAPMFNVADFQGKPVDLSKYKGSIVVLDFWATWCDPCIREFPKLKNVYSKFKDKGVLFIGISLDDDIEDLRGFVKHEEVKWPQVFDGKRWKGLIPSLYSIQIIPTMVVLDQENKVRYIGGDIENVTQIVTSLLSEPKKLPLF
ncbi:MAG: redoxin domain-containing protein [Planctomycetia bacterium]|nr:redoxin domain-containing protein [Planctomycetia bacterium]